MSKFGILSKHLVLTEINERNLSYPLPGLLIISNEIIEDIILLESPSDYLSVFSRYSDLKIFDFSDMYISPGIIDLNVRREWEDMSDLTKSALQGGTTLMCVEDSYYTSSKSSEVLYSDVSRVLVINDTTDFLNIPAEVGVLKAYLFPPCSHIKSVAYLENVMAQALRTNLPVFIDPTLPDPRMLYMASPLRLENIEDRKDSAPNSSGLFAAAYPENINGSSESSPKSIENSSENSSDEEIPLRSSSLQTEDIKKLGFKTSNDDDPKNFEPKVVIFEVKEAEESTPLKKVGKKKNSVHDIYDDLNKRIKECEENFEDLCIAEKSTYLGSGSTLFATKELPKKSASYSAYPNFEISTASESSEPGSAMIFSKPQPKRLLFRPAPILIKPEPKHDASKDYKYHLANYPEHWEIAGVEKIFEVLPISSKIHFQNISSASALNRIRLVKNKFKRVTCEIPAVHLFFTSNDVKVSDTRFKNTPPVRNPGNRNLLWDLLKMKGIDVVSSQHAHIESGKKLTGNFQQALNGIASIGCNLQALWTTINLPVSTNEELEHYIVRLAKWLSVHPSKILGVNSVRGSIAKGKLADLVVWDPWEKFIIGDEYFYRDTSPFVDKLVMGKIKMVYLRGNLAFEAQCLQLGKNFKSEVCESQKLDLKSVSASLSSLDSKKLNCESSPDDDYWECKWNISNSIGKSNSVAGRQLYRWGCAAASIDDKLYLFGGRGADSRPRNSFHVLDLSTNHLSLFRTANTPQGRDGHSMSAYKNLLIIFGGCESGGAENYPFDDIWIVDVENKTWNRPTTTGKKPEPREGHASGVIRNFMVVYGGSGVKSRLSDMFAFNLNNFEWKEIEQHGAVLGQRESMSSTVVHETMYIFGGNVSDLSSENDEYTDDFFAITLKNTTATCKKILPESPIPPKRLSHSLSNLNNKHLVLFGGETLNKALNDIWAYSIEKNCWHEIKPQNQISARMAHVCHCYKDSVIVFGGMGYDQIVKSDLAVLKFGKIEINISNGSGVNPKRKFTKLMNVTSRTVPAILHQESESFQPFCGKCAHFPSTCNFFQKFPDLEYPVLNTFPRVQISACYVDALSSQFSDPFGAMLKIADVLTSISHPSPFINFSIIGTASLKGNSIVKMLNSEYNKEIMSMIKNNNEEEITRFKYPNVVNVPILEISTKLEISPENIMKMCSGVNESSLIPSLFRLSDTSVIVSRSVSFLTIALLYKSETYVPLFFSVFDSNGEHVYPGKELIHSNLVNVYSRSHLQSGDVFKHAQGTSIYVYPKEIESIVGDILHQGNSFTQLVSRLKNVQYLVAGTLIKRNKDFKEEPNKGINFLNKGLTNPFSVLVYANKKLVYWEFEKKHEKNKNNREECQVIKINDPNCVNPVTGLIAWNTKTLNLFSDIYGTNKRKCTE